MWPVVDIIHHKWSTVDNGDDNSMWRVTQYSPLFGVSKIDNHKVLLTSMAN